MNSILQTTKECYICGTTLCLEQHHVLHGSRRRIADRLGLTVWLCPEHHRGANGVHFNHQLDEALKRKAQEEYVKIHGIEEWMKIVRKNYGEVEDGKLH